MINNLSIMFSLLVVGYVVVRAAILDAKRPWFEKASGFEKAPATDAVPVPSGRSSGRSHRPAALRRR